MCSGVTSMGMSGGGVGPIGRSVGGGCLGFAASVGFSRHGWWLRSAGSLCMAGIWTRATCGVFLPRRLVGGGDAAKKTAFRPLLASDCWMRVSGLFFM